jgi:VCBS repeat-containing protein
VANVSSESKPVTEGDTAGALNTSGKLTVGDLDAGQNHVVAQTVEGTYGTIAVAEDGSWTFTSNGAHNELTQGQAVSQSLDVSSADGSAAGTITVNITGSNDAPVLSVSTQSTVVQQGQANAVDVFTASSTDADASHTVTYSLGAGAVATEGNTTYFEISPTTGHITLTHAGAAAIAADPTGNWSVEVIATDDKNAIDTKTVNIEVQQAVHSDGTTATLPGSVSSWNFQPAFTTADDGVTAVPDGFILTRTASTDVSVKIPEGVQSVTFDNATVGL